MIYNSRLEGGEAYQKSGGCSLSLLAKTIYPEPDKTGAATNATSTMSKQIGERTLIYVEGKLRANRLPVWSWM